MFDKRIILFAGHYGSGKTSIALSCATELHCRGNRVALADLDIVNPYFRAKDDAVCLQEQGIDFIASEFANSNLDLPALPQSLYSIIDIPERRVVIDVGGDDRGALALGRLTPAILKENDYEMLLVINKYRPLTATPQDVLEIKNEIELAGGIPFTGIVNNSNLGRDTGKEDVIASLDYAKRCAEMCGLQVAATTADEKLCPELAGIVPELFPLTMTLKNKFI